MDRAGYVEDYDYDDDWALRLGRWRGRVASATRGKRGQKFLKLALKALDQMDDKRLAHNTFGVGDGGCMCLMSSIATETGRASVLSKVARAGEVDEYGYCDDPEYANGLLAGAFDIASPLSQELVHLNDSGCYGETPSQRWRRMRDTISTMIK